MAGGLLNLISYGNENIILNGNPSKSFFKSTYAAYTNYGMQKFRIDQTGNKELQLSQSTKFTFKILRYGDLLMDTYIVVNLPKIWSTIITENGNYRPYEFKWIKNIGCQLIKQITITIGGHIIQQYSGTYIQNMAQRDFDKNKLDMFNKMTGNTNQLNDPANYLNNNGNYPNAININDVQTSESDPSGIICSIEQQQLYIPLNCWFTLSSKMAFPLVALQYNELVIDIEFRPIYDVFVTRHVDMDNYLETEYNQDIPWVRPKENNDNYLFKRFINPPPKRDISLQDGVLYNNLPANYNRYDVHLLCNYCFLDTEEQQIFAQNDQRYLIKTIYEKEYDIKNSASGKLLIETNGLVSNWMWYLQRSDVKLRNEWSNYTNYKYSDIIPNSIKQFGNNTYHSIDKYTDNSINIYCTGNYPSQFQESNVKYILDRFAIICDGKYRENELDIGVYNLLEKYARTNGNSENGLYCYNFAINSDPYSQQPSGAFNTNRFKTIEFEYRFSQREVIGQTLAPLDLSGSNVKTVCDADTDIIIEVKDATNVYQYYYKLYLMEERYNILEFKSGYADLQFSR